MQSTKVTDFQKIRNWQKENGGELFETFSSLEWFVRNHYDELVESGEYIPRKGAKGSMVGRGFDAIVVSILRQNQGGSALCSQDKAPAAEKV